MTASLRAVRPVVGGAVVVGLLAVAVRLPAADVALLACYSVVSAAIVAAVLVVVGRRALRSVRGLLVLTALAPVVATVAGSGVAANVMFISDHDLRAILVVLGSAGTVGVALALLLSDRVRSGTARIVEQARALEDESATTEHAGDLPEELAQVAGELAAAAERLQASRARAAAMETSRRELVAWVSHDLRTPVAGIRAMSEALEDGVVTDEATVVRYHRTIRREADRLSALIDDLFELAEIQAGTVRPDPERIPLADLVSDAVAGASVAAEAKGVLLGRRPGPDGERLTTLSSPELSRVVRNLLDNAIRHTPAGGRVEVEAAVREAEAVVAVHDGCGGIPSADLGRVFDLAFRGDAARSPGDGRAGLGLAIARGLVEANHGSIDVQNEADGCCFTVRLPAVSG